MERFSKEQKAAIARIDEVVKMLNILNFGLINIDYQPNSKHSPFVITKEPGNEYFSIEQPKTHYRYDVIVDGTKNGLQMETAKAVQFAEDLRQISAACRLLQKLHTKHKEMYALHENKEIIRFGEQGKH